MKTRLLLFALLAAGAASVSGVSAQELSPFVLDDLPAAKPDRHYLSYNLMELPMSSLNLGYEWRRDEHFGLKVAFHGGFALSPSLINLNAMRSLGGRAEARWYQPERDRPLYIGVGMGVSAFYERDSWDWGWDGTLRTTLYTPQLVLGYFHRSRRRLACDFSLGLGFIGWSDNSGDYGLVAIPLPVHGGISLTWETGRNPIRY